VRSSCSWAIPLPPCRISPGLRGRFRRPNDEEVLAGRQRLAAPKAIDALPRRRDRRDHAGEPGPRTRPDFTTPRLQRGSAASVRSRTAQATRRRQSLTGRSRRCRRRSRRGGRTAPLGLRVKPGLVAEAESGAPNPAEIKPRRACWTALIPSSRSRSIPNRRPRPRAPRPRRRGILRLDSGPRRLHVGALQD
jgi:hypothetical protein